MYIIKLLHTHTELRISPNDYLYTPESLFSGTSTSVLN